MFVSRPSSWILASHARGCSTPAPVFALALALALTFPVAPGVLAAPSVAPSTDVVHAATPEDIVRAWVAAVNQGDADAAIALYADDAVIEALGQQIRGKAAIARRQRTIIAPVLRPRIEIERLAVDGEAVTARLVGENAITRFDGRGPVHATTTFYLRDGLIQREVGPVLDPADAAWYADAFPRFRATGALPPMLPNTGQAIPTMGATGAVAGVIGVALLVAGVVLVRRRRERSGHT
jgi:ketosteroid isomerase-like protein